MSSEALSSRQIDVLSPSRLAALDCPAQVAFAQHASGAASQGPFALAGTIIHDALERFVQKQDIDDAWEQAVALRIEGDPRETLPGIERMRRRYRRFAGQIIELINQPDTTPHPEFELTSDDGVLGGVADLILERPDSIIVVDYKSGTVESDGVVNPKYEDQIRMYAGLAQQRFEKPVVRGILWSIHQGVVDVDVDVALVEATCNRARLARAEFNERAPGPQPARPAPERCKWCAYKVRCDAFWENCDPSWVAALGHCVEGKVVEVEESDSGARAIRIGEVAGTTTDYDVVAGITADWPIDVGHAVRLTGLRLPAEAKSALRWQFSSTGSSLS